MSETIQKAIEQSRAALPACNQSSLNRLRVVTIIYEAGVRIGQPSSNIFIVDFCKKSEGQIYVWELESVDEKPLYRLDG